MKNFRWHARATPGGWLRQSEYDNLICFASKPLLAPKAAKDPENGTFRSDDVQRIAHLARIEITAGRRPTCGTSSTAFFALIDRMRAVDTSGIVPMAHAQEVTLPLRDDSSPKPTSASFSSGVAPAVADGLYLVPKVIE